MAKFRTETTSALKARAWATAAAAVLVAGFTLVGAAHAQDGDLSRHPVRLALKGKGPIVVSDLCAETAALPEADPTVEMCKSFRMTEHQARLYLKNAKPISAQELDHNRDWLPCHVSGKAQVGKVQLEWTVTASGVGKVWLASAPDNDLAMACDGSCRRQVFGRKD